VRALTPSRLGDVDRMSCHLHFEHSVTASAQRVFDVLANGENQTEWADGYRSTTWFGTERDVGTVRDIHMAWITVRERFLVWEPGARFTFTCDALSIPLAQRLIEDIAFVPTESGTSRLCWDVHFSPSPLLGRTLGDRRVQAMFAPMFGGFAAGLADYAGRHPDGPGPSRRSGET
jgi:hypothetical protein